MTIRKIFYVLLGLSYIVLGLFVWIKQLVGRYPFDHIFSIACIAYGIWRIYRGIQLREVEDQTG